MKSVAFLALLPLGCVLAAGQEPQQPAAGSGTQKSMSASMPEACKSMMAKRDQMMATMKSMDTALDQKVAAMNSASGPAKVNAMADVINEMVSQRKQMEQHMAAMHADMMQHMGSHMMAGKESMMTCPMMQGEAKSKAANR